MNEYICIFEVQICHTIKNKDKKKKQYNTIIQWETAMYALEVIDFDLRTLLLYSTMMRTVVDTEILKSCFQKRWPQNVLDIILLHYYNNTRVEVKTNSARGRGRGVLLLFLLLRSCSTAGNGDWYRP